MVDQVVLSMPLASTLDGSEQTYGTQGGADRRITVAQMMSCFRGYLSGLTLSNSSTNIAVDAGCAVDDTNVDLMVLSSPMTKASTAWVAGTGNGGLDTGTVANANYFWYLIKNPTTGAVDVLFSRSATSP